MKIKAQLQEHTFALFYCPVDREINLEDFPLSRREALVIQTRKILLKSIHFKKLSLHPLIHLSLFRCVLASL